MSFATMITEEMVFNDFIIIKGNDNQEKLMIN